MVGFVFLGVGAMLFLGIFSLFIIRLATQPPLPNPMSPSLWIPLAPAGIFGVAVIRLTEAAIADGIVGQDSLWFALALAVMGIGFGLWWSVFALIDLMRVRANGGIPFHMGWWGFVFPIAAMAISITLVGYIAQLSPLIGLVVTLIAVGVWLTIFIRTIRAVIVESRARKLAA
jgi:tellurite resistance protein TehA-like permease